MGPWLAVTQYGAGGGILTLRGYHRGQAHSDATAESEPRQEATTTVEAAELHGEAALRECMICQRYYCQSILEL